MNLNKDNFWNRVHELYPQSVGKFCDWIDRYKIEVNWDGLFGNMQRAEESRVKFHHIPLDMQIGILMRFANEQNHGSLRLMIFPGADDLNSTMFKLESYFKTMQLSLQHG